MYFSAVKGVLNSERDLIYNKRSLIIMTCRGPTLNICRDLILCSRDPDTFFRLFGVALRIFITQLRLLPCMVTGAGFSGAILLLAGNADRKSVV